MSLLVTILTGGRPRLLRRTLDSIERTSPDVLDAATVVAFLNDPDDDSSAALLARPWVTRVVLPKGARMGIGAAVSHLMAEARLDEHHLLFHLEDDWECMAKGWYEAAQRILGRDRRVGQVRLRRWRSSAYVGSAVSRYHMVTRAPIRWEMAKGKKHQIGRAHFTFNPALMPTSVARDLFPCESELDAAAKFHRSRLLTAQILPGAFRHLGGDDSLRERTGAT